MFRADWDPDENNNSGNFSMIKFNGICPVCGNSDFVDSAVLWRELIDSWQLSEYEVAYVNRQQGFHCTACKNNLRAMGLASALMAENSYEGTLSKFCNEGRELSILEINHAANLSVYLSGLERHRLIEFPEFDMQSMDIQSASYDIVIHSDTLEHVPDPERGLSECRRVLKFGGKCIFTIPVIVDRMSRSRIGLKPSHHGQFSISVDDQIVQTEFGVDMWKTVLKAGFTACKIFAFEYPAALVLIAEK